MRDIPSVLDTNVLVSAALGVGHSRMLLDLLLQRGDPVLSESILEELDETLRSDPRLARLVPAATRARYVALLARAASLVEPGAVDELPDPEDAHVVGTAASAGVPLVTGDKELARVEIPGVRVLSVREALLELGHRP